MTVEHFVTATALDDSRVVVACRCGYLLAATLVNLPTLWDQHRLVMDQVERQARPRLGIPSNPPPTNPPTNLLGGP